jgi:hypothetical protein
VFGCFLHRGAAACAVAGMILTFPMAAPVRAQVLYGSVVGMVQDSSGAVAPGAAIVLTSASTGQNRSTVTNETGLYSLANVLAGTYQLKVTAAGFRPFSETNVAVTINNVARIDVKLEVGGAGTTVRGRVYNSHHRQCSRYRGTS